MGNVRIVLNRGAVRALLRSPEILQRELEPRARRIQEAAGGSDAGFEVGTYTGPNRARATVITATVDAMVAEATSGTLTASIDAGRQ